MNKTIILGSDHGGYNLKRELLDYLGDLGYNCEDVGTNSYESVDYPDFASKVTYKVLNTEKALGILICGTGIGVSIAANKVKGIRCALVSEEFSAKMSREHNDANVLALGQRVIGVDLAKSIVRTWLIAEFKGGRHEERLKKISDLEI